MSITDDALAMRLIDPARASAIRERAGLSTARIAEDLGVNAYTVRRWEKGVSTPRGTMRIRYARLLAALDEALPAA